MTERGENKPKARHRVRPERKQALSGGHDPHRPVGYANPPVHSQFKKGRSGNPKGRPKGRKSLAAIVDELLYEQIAIRDRGRSRRVPMINALLLRIRKDALEGDAKATDRLLRLMQTHTPSAESAAEANRPVIDPSEDRRVLEELGRWIEEGFDLSEDLGLRQSEGGKND